MGVETEKHGADVENFLDDYELPCAVMLPPSTTLSRRVKLRELIFAMDIPQRNGLYFEPKAPTAKTPGCICPPAANLTCEAPLCPRKAVRL